MPWSWSNIDWSRTEDAALIAALLLTAVVGWAATGSRRFRRAILEVARLPLVRVAGGIFLIQMAVLVLLFVALKEEDGWIGDVMAAWVQAIGSIVAIVAAIWIDQGSARRLRRQHEGEREESRLARLGAIAAAESGLRVVADRFEARFLEEGVRYSLAPSEVELINAAISTIEYFLRIPQELDVTLVRALAGAAETMSPYRTIHGLGVTSRREQYAWVATARKSADDLRILRETYEEARR